MWLAETLWPDSPSDVAQANLRRTLTDLRQALGSTAHVIESPTPLSLRLLGGELFLDVAEFDRLAMRSDPASLREAVHLCSGTLLEGCDEAWVVHERGARESVLLEALDKLGAAARNSGDLAAAIRWLKRAHDLDPYREPVVRDLLRAYTAEGNHAEAAMLYHGYRDRLKREMNSSPDPETVELFNSIKAEVQRQPTPPTSVVLKDLGGESGTLPTPLTSFVGREREVDEIGKLLRSSRAVTILGPGGMGKTRLAIRVAEGAREIAADGAWFVDLSHLRGDTSIVPAVAATLGVRETSGRTLEELVYEHINSIQLLLILDNCEQIVQPSARLVESLLSQCPNAKLLITSRQCLDAPGEVVWRTPAMELPEAKHLPDKDEGLALVLPRYEAVRLFVERATAAHPAFSLNERNAQATMRIVRRLEGIPLAIELAAACIRMLSAEQVAARLDERFRLLSRGNVAGPERHQTLRATLDWSYDLLPANEKLLLQGLSVFAGGWTLEGAIAICEVSASSSKPVAQQPDPLDVLDALTSLADKSFITVDMDETTERRYRMLETIREYAFEHLQATGNEDETRQRHFDYIASIANSRAQSSTDSTPPEWLEKMKAEHENLRTALDHAPRNGRRTQLAIAAYWYWNVRGFWHEARNQYENCSTNDETNNSLKAETLNCVGTIAWRQSDYVTAAKNLEACIALRRLEGNEAGIASALGNLGLVLVDQGLYERGRHCHEEALELDRKLGNLSKLAGRLSNLGLVLMYECRYIEAAAHFQEAAALYRQQGLLRGLSIVLINRALMELKLGNLDNAQLFNREAATLSTELGNRGLYSYGTHGLGMVAYASQQYPLAAKYYKEALSVRLDIGDNKGIVDSLFGVSEVLLKSNMVVQAGRMWGASERLRNEIGAAVSPMEQSDYDTVVASLQSGLGDEYTSIQNAVIEIKTADAVTEAIRYLDEISEQNI
jgi:predicted ATPase/DNA-binding SARP family transcriptional activator